MVSVVACMPFRHASYFMYWKEGPGPYTGRLYCDPPLTSGQITVCISQRGHRNVFPSEHIILLVMVTDQELTFNEHLLGATCCCKYLPCISHLCLLRPFEVAVTVLILPRRNLREKWEWGTWYSWLYQVPDANSLSSVPLEAEVRCC